MSKRPAIRFKGHTSDWTLRKLSTMCGTFEYGLNAAATEYDGRNKYIRITDIDDASREFSTANLSSPATCLEGMERYLLTNGDIVFARTGASTGKTYLYKERDGVVYFAGFLIRTKVNKENDPEFVFQNTLTPGYEKYIKITSQRSGQPGVNAQEYGNYELFAPLIEEQIQIGHSHKNLDELILWHQRKYDKLQTYKKAMLEKMFPKDGADVPEVRFAGFVDSWTRRSFSEITFLSGQKNKDNLPLESYSITNENGFVPQNEKFENGGTMKDADKRMYYIVTPHSFAYNPARINIGSIGYYDLSKDVIVSSLYEVFKTTDEVDDRFLWHWFKSDDFQRLIYQLQEGGVRLYFYYDKLCMGQLALPRVEEQKKIGAYFDQLDNLIAFQRRKLERLKVLKKALLDKMFI